MRLSSVPLHGGGRPGWDGGLSLGPLPPRTVASQAPSDKPRRRGNDWGWSDPGTLLGHLLFRRAARCSPSAGLLVGGQHACVQGTEAYSSLSPPVLGPHGGRSHTCRAPPWPAPLAASPTQPVSESGRYFQNSPCPAGREEQTPTPVKLATYMDTLGHADAPAACNVMKPSGRAGGPVKKETSRREEE